MKFYYLTNFGLRSDLIWCLITKNNTLKFWHGAIFMKIENSKLIFLPNKNSLIVLRKSFKKFIQEIILSLGHLLGILLIRKGIKFGILIMEKPIQLWSHFSINLVPLKLKLSKDSSNKNLKQVIWELIVTLDTMFWTYWKNKKSTL